MSNDRHFQWSRSHISWCQPALLAMGFFFTFWLKYDQPCYFFIHVTILLFVYGFDIRIFFGTSAYSCCFFFSFVSLHINKWMCSLKFAKRKCKYTWCFETKTNKKKLLWRQNVLHAKWNSLTCHISITNRNDAGVALGPTHRQWGSTRNTSLRVKVKADTIL